LQRGAIGVNPRVERILSNAFGWFAFQVAEIFILGALLKLVVPPGWSRALQLAVVLPVLVAVVIANYRIRRRLPPFLGPPRGRPSTGSD
jgi:hypothetical protein